MPNSGTFLRDEGRDRVGHFCVKILKGRTSRGESGVQAGVDKVESSARRSGEIAYWIGTVLEFIKVSFLLCGRPGLGGAPKPTILAKTRHRSPRRKKSLMTVDGEEKVGEAAGIFSSSRHRGRGDNLSSRSL
jgi:hypothetical protein